MTALRSGHGKFGDPRLALNLRAGDRRRSVRAAAFDLVQSHLSLFALGKTEDDHAVVQQSRVERDDGALLTTMLRCRPGAEKRIDPTG